MQGSINNGGFSMGQQFDIENEKVTIDKDGIITECDVLFSFDSEDTGKAYIGYTDHSIAANGRKNTPGRSSGWACPPVSPRPFFPCPSCWCRA